MATPIIRIGKSMTGRWLISTGCRGSTSVATVAPGTVTRRSRWRASNGGNPIEKRKLNLKIHKNGIKEIGDGPRPYTPINLYAAAAGVDPDQAFVILSQLKNGSVVINLQPKETAALPAPEASPVSVPAEPVDRGQRCRRH